MNRAVNELLERLLEDHEALLPGFGLERLTIAGEPIGPSTYLWEERLTLQGSGDVGLDTRRSIADMSGEEIGEYRSTECEETVLGLVRLVRETGLDELPAFEIDPIDVRVRFSIVGGGTCHEYPIGVQDPEALEPLQPLLGELDRLALEVRKHPVATLGVSLELPSEAGVGEHQLPVMLRFRNSGNVGTWVTHPGAMEGTPETDHCSLLYCYREELEPDVTPVPPEIFSAQLDSTQADQEALLWLAGASEVALESTASVSLPDPGTYLARAVYSCYSGEDTVGGQRRLRGCVFSNELAIEVE